MHVLLLAPGAGVATRVPVLACADGLRQGASVEIVPAESDAEVDAWLARAEAEQAAVVVAGGDGPLRAVLRRAVRRVLPRGGARPDDLAADRTVPDLPAFGVLPLEPVGAVPDLASRLGLPRSPADVAAAVLAGDVRRVDLLRNDGGSVTLHGALLGGADEQGRPVPWQARIDVDDAVLCDGTEPLLACAVANADGYASVGGLPLLLGADPADGVLDVGVALPAGRRRRATVEVRRARGRAVAVTLTCESVHCTDDGVDGVLRAKRTWWMERGAWGVYQPAK